MELLLEHRERSAEPALRISGVVAMCNDVRRRVAEGLTPEAREDLRAEVAASLHQIEELCAAHGASPEDLPGPSRSAYRYLKTIDWNKVPLPSVDGGAGEPSMHLKGLLRSYLRIQHDLQHAKGGEARQRALERARRVAERVELLCGETGPESLSSKERGAYLHLKEFAEGRTDPGADIRLIREAFRELGLEEPASVLLLYYPYAGLKSGIRRRGAVVEVKLSDGWRRAPEEVRRGLAVTLVCRLEGLECPETRRRAVDGFLDADGRAIHGELRRERGYKLLPGPEGSARDLGESFERVNRSYFGGGLPRPDLSWSAERTRNLFGHQDPAMNAIVISRTLDDPEVPEFVLDYVMFHEMLHVKHGATRDNGRRVVHPPEFREDLRRFEMWSEAEEWVRRLAAEESADSLPEARPAPRPPGPKVGRNDPCPCGSGRKFKRCCMADARKGGG